MTEEAIELLGEAFEENKAAPLLEARGALYAALGFPRAAAGDFQRAVTQAPERAEAWYGLGKMYEELHLSRQAIESLTRALELGNDGMEVHVALARAYRDLGRLGQSARHYTRVLDQDPLPDAALLVEAARLASPPDALSADALAESLGDLQPPVEGGWKLEDAWLVRSLLAEGESESDSVLAAYLRASDIEPAALAAWAKVALRALELGDPETSPGKPEALAGR
jgi:tetratricopeptide (TPR) repeat protein